MSNDNTDTRHGPPPFPGAVFDEQAKQWKFVGVMDEDEDDVPLTVEELAERDKVPTFGGPLFVGVVTGPGLTGDILPE